MMRAGLIDASIGSAGRAGEGETHVEEPAAG
jgi:hypothetical protein